MFYDVLSASSTDGSEEQRSHERKQVEVAEIASSKLLPLSQLTPSVEAIGASVLPPLFLTPVSRASPLHPSSSASSRLPSTSSRRRRPSTLFRPVFLVTAMAKWSGRQNDVMQASVERQGGRHKCSWELVSDDIHSDTGTRHPFGSVQTHFEWLVDYILPYGLDRAFFFLLSSFFFFSRFSRLTALKGMTGNALELVRRYQVGEPIPRLYNNPNGAVTFRDFNKELLRAEPSAQPLEPTPVQQREIEEYQQASRKRGAEKRKATAAKKEAVSKKGKEKATAKEPPLKQRPVREEPSSEGKSSVDDADEVQIIESDEDVKVRLSFSLSPPLPQLILPFRSPESASSPIGPTPLILPPTSLLPAAAVLSLPSRRKRSEREKSTRMEDRLRRS
jgi:hypothetical protein